LKDSCKSVVRRAAEIYSRGSDALDVATLNDALSTASARTRGALLHAGRALGKWEALALLLRESAQGEDASVQIAHKEIARWLQRTNRRFSPLSPALASELPAILQAAIARHPESNWHDVSLHIRSAL
jgi:hypothetical protein